MEIAKVNALLDSLEELIAAADGVTENWERGDLAGAVNVLEGAADDARALLEALA